MKNKLILLPLLLLNQLCFSQYFQQRTDYIIDVTLNVQDKTLDAFEKISYTNNSPDTLKYIWFHLWPNAYKNDRTAYSDQSLETGDAAFYFSNKEERGYINRLDFKVDGISAKTEDHPQHIDIIRLILPKALPPGNSITITTPFHVKLPYNFSRGGYYDNTFQITQWYPKPAVYDYKGWHPIPYLDQGEFYSEFGKFDVRITLPENYVVAATGVLQNEEEYQFLKTRDSARVKKHMVNPVQNSVKTKAFQNKVIVPSKAVKTKTLNYLQDSIHDFAWFANKDFIVKSDTCALRSGKIVKVYSFFTPEQASIWENSVQFEKDAIRFYSDEVGEYPFSVVSAVQGPKSFGGGMEYPTITSIAPAPSEKLLDEVIAHELGHNWFYGVLATNERLYPWMDEGINSFYEYRYMDQKYGGKAGAGLELLLETKAVRGTDQPINLPAEQFTETNYGLVVYHKTAEWMKWLEQKMGKENFRNMMHRYFSTWGFRHPYPDDFKALVQEQLPGQADSIFHQLDMKGIPPGHEAKGFRVVSPFKKGSIRQYIQQPSKDILFLSPAIGINSYDRLMAGIMVSNYKLPPNRFQFLAIPLYATGTKKLNGLGRMDYTIPGRGLIRKTDVLLTASHFTMDEFRDSADRKLYMQFSKLVPGVRFTLKEKQPNSTASRYIQWKTYLFSEQSLKIVPDTIFNGPDTSLILRYLRPSSKRYLNQLQLVIENYRTLYPFDVTLQVEQAKDFIRPAVTAHYFFNYRGGGLSVRGFAGKFIYLNGKTTEKQFANDRYQLNMTGANGYEDYTYSDYFLGRNKFEELESHQIMMRDGGFKVRTDLLANKMGKTDNWLAAVNLNSSIPDKLNPLSVLPIKIPLHLFLDIGTYADAWEKNADTDRFLYDMGLHIPLLNETVNFYFPILYNKSYGDYFKSMYPKNRFFKSMSFTINLYNSDMKKLNRELEF